MSVAMCTYNGEKFIHEQIDSILNQTQKVDEIIVCDDGSTDKTIAILEKYSERNPKLFKIYQNKINLQSVKNFEKAINLCNGEIIFLSDQDDIWKANKVENYIKHFNKNPEISVLASNGYCIDDKSQVIKKYTIWDVPQFLKDANIEVNYYEIIAFIGNIATGASMAFRRSFVNTVIPFPVINKFHHDEWIALLSSKCNSFELLNEKYFYYRIHHNQQVGGVFYDKTEKTKTFLTSLFDVKNEKILFKIFRKRLRHLKSFVALNQSIDDDNFEEFTNANINDAKNQIELLNKKMKKGNIVIYLYYELFFKKNIKK